MITENNFVLSDDRTTLKNYIGDSGHVIIPASVKIIDSNAFEANKSVKSISFERVNYYNPIIISSEAFRYSNIEIFECKRPIKFIGSFAFEYCKNLKYVNVSNIEFVAKNAFSISSGEFQSIYIKCLNIYSGDSYWFCKNRLDITIECNNMPDNMLKTTSGMYRNLTVLK